MTAMEFPADEMGASAAQMVIGQVEAPPDTTPTPCRLVFSAVLEEREST